MRGSAATILAGVVTTFATFGCGDTTGPERAGDGPHAGRIVFAFDSTVVPNVDVTIGAGSIAPDGSDRLRIADVPGFGELEGFLVAPGASRFALLRGTTLWTFLHSGRQLHQAEALADAEPQTWTVDGDRLLWLRPPPIFEQALYTSAPDGGERQFLDLPSFETVRQVRYMATPEGLRLVFEARTNSLRDVWIAGATGANPRRLTDNRSNYQFPEPSPDGRRIAFIDEAGQSRSGGRIVGLSAVDAASGDVARLLTKEVLEPEGTHLVLLARWSPTGDRIAAYAASPNTGIWVVNRDGSDETLMWDAPGDVSGMAWSPEGDRIVISRRPDRHADWELVIVDANSGARENITETPAVDEVFPVWLP